MLLVVVVVIVLIALRRRSGTPEEFPYEMKRKLFSHAERSFYGILKQAVREDGVVFGKVRVADVLNPSKGLDRSNWQKAFNHISSKHFDYVICSPDDLSVLFVIELDDKSHAKRVRVERDQLIEGACSTAGLILHRFKARATYNIPEVREVFFPPSKEDISEEELVPEKSFAVELEQPLCPRCSSPLIIREAKKGEHKGKEFLGCSEFPNCRYTENN